MSRSRSPHSGDSESQGSAQKPRTRDEHVDAAIEITEPDGGVLPVGLAGKSDRPGLHKTRVGDAKVHLLLATVSEVAERRTGFLRDLRAACIANEQAEVLRLARLLVGLDGG